MPDAVVRVSMLIRRPAAAVFDAFVDPGKITQFWLDGSSGPLAKNARVEWRFMVPGASETVTVTAFEPPRRIGFDWSDGIRVAMTFEDFDDDSTRLSVEATGFRGENAGNDVVDATEGFAIVLCDLKTWLETGRSANLVRDKAALIAASRS